MTSRRRSLLWVLSMPVGYAAACATMVAGALLVISLGAPEELDGFRSWRGASAASLFGAVMQLTLVGMVLAAPVAVPVMIVFRHAHVGGAWIYAVAGALVVAVAAVFVKLVTGLIFQLADLAVFIAIGPLAGLVYWLIAGRRQSGLTVAPPGSG